MWLRVQVICIYIYICIHMYMYTCIWDASEYIGIGEAGPTRNPSKSPLYSENHGDLYSELAIRTTRVKLCVIGLINLITKSP